MNASDRRKHPRIKKQLRIVLHKKRFFFLWEGRDVAELVDISIGGAQINTKRNLKLGDRVVVTIQPRTYSPSVHFHGRVVWVKTRYTQSIKYRQAGIRFRTLGVLQHNVMRRIATPASARQE